MGTTFGTGWFGDRDVPLPLGEAFHSRRLTMRSSQVEAMPAHRRVHWTSQQQLELALRLVADDQLDTLISGESPFEVPAGGDAVSGKESCRRCVTAFAS